MPSIAEPKIRALRQLLERDGRVPFKTGRVVEVEPCEPCGGTGKTQPVGIHGQVVVDPKTCGYCDGEGKVIAVVGLAGGRSRRRLDELAAVYTLAQHGPPPIPQPKGDPAAYGDCPF